ncbi:hypothetical protein BDR26DRAFT_916227 [Obelidium mucronatum]|nr:hypothetical protein BDR26DRAFT_916227 [Obelidium mucronatum]
MNAAANIPFLAARSSSVSYCWSTPRSLRVSADVCTPTKHVNRVGFEPTHPEIPAPEAGALDRSAICPIDLLKEIMIFTNARHIEIHLIGQWYTPKSRARLAELVRVLAINTNNTYIDKIHLIQPIADFQTLIPKRNQIHAYFYNLLDVDPYFPIELFLAKLVLSTTNHKGRLLASDAFRYASKTLKHDPKLHHIQKVAILSNQDIYFDSSLSLLQTSPFSNLGTLTAYFLSRYEENAEAEEESLIGTQCGPRFIGSHDAFVFMPPLPEPLIRNCEFELGSWGIEARLLWEFEQFGILGRNPCEDIKIWHVHRGGYKEGVDRIGVEEAAGKPEINPPMPEVNTNGKSSIAFPDTLKTKFKDVVEELWGANLVEKRKRGEIKGQ